MLVIGSDASFSPPFFLSTLPSLFLSLSFASILTVVSLNTFWSNQLLVILTPTLKSTSMNSQSIDRYIGPFSTKVS
ncbi:unnamed protein product [Hymenolepis diminuta]|uniref:Uncharacterized protein n=1 Tax=Hymenolepis diminuta TaxID=6216 RepID=A0A564XW33_HYMDI|nr:unnamed protein product [Hymenolepis diminuta]